ncbi:uncharacterized protein MONOS_16063 [Monocercomonoides exilis]|uniref:uncharacterized protein n=1 Tax=Monocercomonoides exilis TaxID=2049356 RepID=UPI00355AC8A1|nr:hypothetical protein MONOS_16063 [Monocercomonoides exilis]|eukprot:MONOS_16063.1-p1 / transcript=MONOS_16063.1 / gene=MONOS_16063 / organism=Monocercomonoides_exilis_PA203 / gene_product=unspecified product / transcript_product=unspecified product / location=Mono_scaffold01483:5966-6259(-) / protein_length=98 / sequence_SO=supercontig / SO=protein_coding / is_pseudo=false
MTTLKPPMARSVEMRCSIKFLMSSSNRSTGEAALRAERLASEGKREEAGRARRAGQVRGEGMDRYVGEAKGASARTKEGGVEADELVSRGKEEGGHS